MVVSPTSRGQLVERPLGRIMWFIQVNHDAKMIQMCPMSWQSSLVECVNWVRYMLHIQINHDVFMFQICPMT